LLHDLHSKCVNGVLLWFPGYWEAYLHQSFLQFSNYHTSKIIKLISLEKECIRSVFTFNWMLISIYMKTINNDTGQELSSIWMMWVGWVMWFGSLLFFSARLYYNKNNYLFYCYIYITGPNISDFVTFSIVWTLGVLSIRVQT
jgi:hypothetical protein